MKKMIILLLLILPLTHQLIPCKILKKSTFQTIIRSGKGIPLIQFKIPLKIMKKEKKNSIQEKNIVNNYVKKKVRSLHDRNNHVTTLLNLMQKLFAVTKSLLDLKNPTNTTHHDFFFTVMYQALLKKKQDALARLIIEMSFCNI